MKERNLKPLWITLIVLVSLLIVAVILGVLNGTVGNGEWQIGIQSYRYESEGETVGSGTVYREDIREIQIDWIRGDVEIEITEDDRYISVSEFSEASIPEAAKVRWWVDENGALIIKSRQTGNYLASSMPKKNLIVRIPKSMVEASVKTSAIVASGDVEIGLFEDVDFTVDFQTVGGKMLSDIPLREEGGAFVYGDGTARLEIETKKGSLFIKKNE